MPGVQSERATRTEKSMTGKRIAERAGPPPSPAERLPHQSPRLVPLDGDARIGRVEAPEVKTSARPIPACRRTQ